MLDRILIVILFVSAMIVIALELSINPDYGSEMVGYNTILIMASDDAPALSADGVTVPTAPGDNIDTGGQG